MIEPIEQILNKEEIGLRIRSIRGGRTQKEFAEITGATQSFISDLERGKSFPSISFLAVLVDLSGKSYDWILTGREEPKPPVEEVEEEPEKEAPEPEAVEEKEEPPVREEMRWELRKEGPPPAPPHGDIDYNYLQHLVTVLRDAPPTEKPRFVKIIVSYLLTNL